MRVSPRVTVLLATLAAACASSSASGPFRPADQAQAAPDAANEAVAEAGGVGVRALVGHWNGQPVDLEQRLTPVDVAIANRLDRPIRIGPEAFQLVPGNGSPLRVLTQDEVATRLRSLAGFRPRPAPRVGAVGGPTFPGYDAPFGAPPRSPVPPPGHWYETQDPSGELPPGRQTALLLFFDTPARTLRSATFQVRLTDASGKPVGEVRLPFARQ